MSFCYYYLNLIKYYINSLRLNVMLGIMSTAEVFLVRGLLKGMSDKDTEIQPYVLLEPNLFLFSPRLSLSQLFVLFVILAKGKKMNSYFQHCT